MGLAGSSRPCGIQQLHEQPEWKDQLFDSVKQQGTMGPEGKAQESNAQKFQKPFKIDILQDVIYMEGYISTTANAYISVAVSDMVHNNKCNP